MYEKDLFYIAGKEPGDKDTLEEKRKQFFTPTDEKGEVPCWYWKKNDIEWERYDKELQLIIEIHYRERRPSVRVDADHYIVFADMKQRRFDSSHRKRSVKREMEIRPPPQEESNNKSEGEREKGEDKNEKGKEREREKEKESEEQTNKEVEQKEPPALRFSDEVKEMEAHEAAIEGNEDKDNAHLHNHRRTSSHKKDTKKKHHISSGTPPPRTHRNNLLAVSTV